MSELSDRIAREHPNYYAGSGRVCGGCGADIEAVDGDVTAGWHRHLIEVTEATVRAEATVTPGREAIARAIDPDAWYVVDNVPIGENPGVWDRCKVRKKVSLVAASNVLALLPGRPETAVKAEALNSVRREVSRAVGLLGSAPGGDKLGYHEGLSDALAIVDKARADLIERGE